jgi:amino acid transporter
VSNVFTLPKRLLVGTPLRNERMGETLLPKRIALPVFCSDPLSSNAYATEEILLMLSVGGLALLHLAPAVAAAVVLLLVVVIASYRQTCHAYPNGGGAYAVSRDNLGAGAALVAASALLVDYVLTVAVSVAAGVANIVAAAPSLGPYAVGISLGLVTLLAVMNLRGVKESGSVFAVPTYGFVVCVFGMLAVGLVASVLGHPPVAESAGIGIRAPEALAPLVVLGVVLRAFASGCTALTGVEAVSNGVPSFRHPKSKNAAATLAIMGTLTVAMFAGITALAMISQVHVAHEPDQLVGAPAGYVQRTVIAQLSAAVFGPGSAGFYLVQAFTAAILVLAANTAFNGFPILASILGRDGYLPRQFARRGDRLVFSNGIVILSVLAGVLIAAFDADVSRLIQLYILGVFVSFTLSQSGMVRHWSRAIRLATRPAATRPMVRARLLNGLGAVVTALVLVIVLVTKFTHGAWIVVVAMPLLVALMLGVRRHYEHVDRELAPPAGGVGLPSRVHGIVLVSRLNTPALRALAFARATRPSTLTALTVRADAAETEHLVHDWQGRGIPVDLTVLDSPFRDITRPALQYIQRVHREGPRDIVVVFVPEYVVAHWWEHALHNQSALRLKTRLLFQPGVMVTSVPWVLEPRSRAARRGVGDGDGDGDGEQGPARGEAPATAAPEAERAAAGDLAAQGRQPAGVPR